MASEKPSNIAGGCLCGAIRYVICFEDEHAWPPMISTCQCSTCRKWSGCLVSHDLVVKKSQVSPDWSVFPTFTKYASTPGTDRAFCSNCGSGLAWFNDHMVEDVIIFVGTVDEKYLLGEVDESTIKETQYGQHFDRKPGLAHELTDATMAGNLYWQNAIAGATDHLAGPRFLQHFLDKAPLPEKKA